MVHETASKQECGCEHCWPVSATDAWNARDYRAQKTMLVDESHFIVTIKTCRVCSQRFLSIFTETIDWVDGEDPQHWTILPITASEETALLQSGDSLTEAALKAVGVGRKSLDFDRPKDASPSCAWGIGIFIGPHD